ncbi:MAG: TIGR02646 family protein [Verrucomicrobia bacterium]|nr:TIGR02646 family protein [Verrucomicrobiota bacterium]
MIRITRTQPAPRVLQTKGKQKAKAHCAAYARNAADYHTGRRRFTFDAAIYGHREVKQRLIKMQHDKCAFCESQVTHVAHGDVEHFRPKGGCRQNESEPMQKPGYYWLAYTWENLLFACQLCNQRHKANLFPLQDDSRRARQHSADVAQEAPTFIDPSTEDPEALIAFDNTGTPYAVGNNARAAETIRALGLDRPELNIRRFDRLEILKSLRDLIVLLPRTPDAIKAKRHLHKRVQSSAEYAAMTRGALPEYRR